MTDPFGELLTRWTIRLALACYVFCLAAAILRRGKGSSGGNQVVRIVWTLGCGLFLAHVVAAFGYYHHFSHQAAYDDTAQQTQEQLGFAFGGGIYFSYVFLAVWVADVAWRWMSPASRPTWLDWPLHAYMFFIAFNGAIVFEGGVSRWAGIIACVVLAGIVCLKASGRRKPPGD
ncbi:MAG: hypothetical protein IAF94_13380 [Pirellulaceae bacterium]|nr:hypothetical protein [Pirellulaceae bacterium]